jgi:hypothetical protein
MAAALPSVNAQKRGKGADDAYATPCFVQNDGDSNQVGCRVELTIHVLDRAHLICQGVHYSLCGQR